MHQSLAERLTDRFYDWELRGRGWYVFDVPVTPEPPYAPFLGHYFDLVAEAPHDDGREHTRFSALIDRVASFFRPAAQTPEPLPEIDESITVDEGVERTRLSIVLPQGVTYPKDLAEQFLLNLSQCRHPICLEFVGRPGEVTLALDVAAPDAGAVTAQLQTHYPEAIVTSGRDVLRDEWNVEASTLVAELGLSDEFMLPLRSYRSFTPDPLGGVIGALGSLKSGELACLQVLFEPVGHPWASSIVRAVTTPDGRSFFGNDSRFVKETSEKLSSPLYGAVIRVMGQSPLARREREIVRSLVGALSVLDKPQSNRLIPLENDLYNDTDHAVDLLERRSRRSGMILSADELLSLVHLPGASIATPALVRSIAKTKRAPAIAERQSLVLGVNQHVGEAMEVGQSVETRLRHTYVIGASGSGKSTLLASMIRQDIESGVGFGVLDPHGDLIDQVIRYVPPERFDDVVLLDLSDESYPIPFNILRAHSELEKNLLASDLAAVFQRLATSWGDQMTAVLANAILAILESDRGGTLRDLRRFLVEKRFRDKYLPSVRDPEVVYYWTHEFPMLSGKPQGSVVTRLNTFLRPKPIRYMVGHGKNHLDVSDIMDSGKILLARIPQGAIGEENAYLLGTLLVSAFHRSALCRQEKQASTRRPFFLYIDEFHHFVTPSMATILSGARKYGLGLVLAHQELRQLESRDAEVASAVLSNPGTRICFRLGDRDARQLESGFASFDARDLQSLSVGEAICRMERADFDFNLSVIMPPEVDEGVARDREMAIRERSRARYAVPRSDVEAILNADQESIESRPEVQPAESQPPEATRTGAEQKIASTQSDISYLGEGVPSRSSGASSTPAQAPVRDAAPPQSTPGRGGPRHKSIQSKIKQWGQGMGYGAQIEKPILDGRGAVDVALGKGDVSIACEISITTPTEHECRNLEKCVEAGFTHVVMVCDNEERLAKVKEAAEAIVQAELIARVRFMLVDDVFGFLEAIEQSMAKSESTIRDRTVRVNRRSPSDPHRQAGMRSIGRTIAKALRRRQGSGGEEAK